MNRRPLDLSRVKTEASFEQILDRYGVKLLGAGAKRMALCPFHKDTKPSCSIHLERKIFHCFGCGARGLRPRLRRPDREHIDPRRSRAHRRNLRAAK